VRRQPGAGAAPLRPATAQPRPKLPRTWMRERSVPSYTGTREWPLSRMRCDARRVEGWVGRGGGRQGGVGGVGKRGGTRGKVLVGRETMVTLWDHRQGDWGLPLY
jgi:hypothetical protein